MPVAEDLRTLASGIIDSYEIRISTVNTLMYQAYRFLESFQMELEDMIVQLRDNLAKTESLRKKDLDHMINDVIERRRENEEELQQKFRLFNEQEKDMITRLREIILKGNRSSLEDIEAIREDISKRQKEREKTIIRDLKRFQIEQEELRISLKNILSKGEAVKIKDLRSMLRAIRAQQNDRDVDLARILDDFEVVRDRVQAQWQGVSRVSG